MPFGNNSVLPSHYTDNMTYVCSMELEMCQARILVADDETDIRNILRRLLLSEGFCVCEAGNGIEALAAAEHCDIDLVLLDITMPRMSGTEAVRELRANPRHASTPIILMTGNAPSGIATQLGD